MNASGSLEELIRISDGGTEKPNDNQ